MLLYLLTCSGFILSSIAPVEINRAWYVGLSQAMCVFGLAWMLIALLYYVPAPKFLTIYLRRTMIGFHFHWASICTVAAFALLSLASIVWFVLHWEAAGWTELCYALTYILCTFLTFIIFYIEQRILYLPVKK